MCVVFCSVSAAVCCSIQLYCYTSRILNDLSNLPNFYLRERICDSTVFFFLMAPRNNFVRHGHPRRVEPSPASFCYASHAALSPAGPCTTTFTVRRAASSHRRVVAALWRLHSRRRLDRVSELRRHAAERCLFSRSRTVHGRAGAPRPPRSPLPWRWRPRQQRTRSTSRVAC